MKEAAKWWAPVWAMLRWAGQGWGEGRVEGEEESVLGKATPALSRAAGKLGWAGLSRALDLLDLSSRPCHDTALQHWDGR